MIEAFRPGKIRKLRMPWACVHTHGESSTSKSFVIAPEFWYWSLPVPWGVALREKSQNAWKPPTYGWGEATALDTRAPLHQRSRRFSYRRDRRLGRRPRRVQEAPGRASGGQRHGLHHCAAPRPEPRQHDGGFAGGPYVNASPAGDRRHENRTRACLCHSSWRLSLGGWKRWVAAFRAASAARRTAAFRLPAKFPGSRIWTSRRLRGPFRNRRR